MRLDKNWFTEICEECGSAFSMELIEKLHEEQSEFQKIEIFETRQFGTLMVIDGFVMLTDRDNFIYHEMMAHPALYSHAEPLNVVIIGGGDCGTLTEVLKHDEVQRVRQIDIDERVTRLAEQYFPDLCRSNSDPRASLQFEDGIQWIKQSEAGSLDVIIIDSTDPIGPALGLFSEPFYRDCLRALGKGGILVQQSESPLFHTESIIKPMHEAMSSAGFNPPATLHFPQCTYPSGWWTATLACVDGSVSFVREDKAQHQAFTTQYYSAQIHRASAALPPFLATKLGR